MSIGDTIAAIATPLGIGGIGVIRLSGPDAVTITQQFIPPTHRLIPNQIRYSEIRSPQDNSLIDDGCIAYFKAPRSYTGEDTIEFHLHGSVHILKRLLSELIAQGARSADPGEFTRRAFISGKLDLTKAESVIDVIHSTNDRAHAVALNHLQGGLFRQIEAIRAPLMRLLEQVEGSIDFPDEVDAIDRVAVKTELTELKKIIQKSLRLKDFGRWITAGIKCVIIGKPNAGKSSLMNQLAGEPRAIVSAIPGTTRDFIEVRIELGGVLFEFIDTAGIRETDDPVELMGVKRVKTLIKQADLIIWVVDHSQTLTPEDHAIGTIVHRKKHGVIILNKADKRRKADISTLPNIPQIEVSAKSGTGIPEFKHYLTQTFISQIDTVNLDLLCNVRQQACLSAVLIHLEELIAGMDTAPNDDLFAFDLRQAVMKLGELTGDTFNETVLDGIFSRFCVGK
jgi:tRNA modification GTPase